MPYIGNKLISRFSYNSLYPLHGYKEFRIPVKMLKSFYDWIHTRFSDCIPQRRNSISPCSNTYSNMTSGQSQYDSMSNRHRNDRNLLAKLPINRGIAMVDFSKEALKPYYTYNDKTVCFVNGNRQDHVYAEFPETHTLFMFQCDPEFVSSTVTIGKFPSLKRLYTSSQPASFAVFHRHQHNSDYKCYVEEELYNKYLNKWWDEDIDHIKPITKQKLSESSFSIADDILDNDE